MSKKKAKVIEGHFTEVENNPADIPEKEAGEEAEIVGTEEVAQKPSKKRWKIAGGIAAGIAAIAIMKAVIRKALADAADENEEDEEDDRDWPEEMDLHIVFDDPEDPTKEDAEPVTTEE